MCLRSGIPVIDLYSSGNAVVRSKRFDNGQGRLNVLNGIRAAAPLCINRVIGYGCVCNIADTAVTVRNRNQLSAVCRQ
ncbi:hypothetical protein Barb6_02051 [Bacteroidales bacterium Barb6]|nr:hypothetical protein Barb6_02051 [Bacteroidales bacterium Barb6]